MTTSPPLITTYNKAIKVTVDGPREPRSKNRHQTLSSFPSLMATRHFVHENLSFNLPVKVNGLLHPLGNFHSTGIGSDWPNLSQSQTCLRTTSGQCQQKSSNLYHYQDKNNNDSNNSSVKKGIESVTTATMTNFQNDVSSSLKTVHNQFLFNQAITASLLLHGPLLNSNHWVYSHLYNFSNDWNRLQINKNSIPSISSSKDKVIETSTPTSSSISTSSLANVNTSKKSHFWRPY